MINPSVWVQSKIRSLISKVIVQKEQPIPDIQIVDNDSQENSVEIAESKRAFTRPYHTYPPPSPDATFLLRMLPLLHSPLSEHLEQAI